MWGKGERLVGQFGVLVKVRVVVTIFLLYLPKPIIKLECLLVFFFDKVEVCLFVRVELIISFHIWFALRWCAFIKGLGDRT